MSEWNPFDSEVIVEQQREIRGAIYPETGGVGLQMMSAGEVVCEVWISAASIPEVIDWLQFAHGRLTNGQD